MLQIPTDNQELIDKGFQILEDWAHQVSFDSDEIDKERGVVIEELRVGLGADDRMRKKAFPVIFKGSLYAERLPIGTLEVLQSFEHETIRDFYKKWYRPNLQAVVVVGDIDVDEMEQKIISHFKHIKNPDNAPERKVYDLPDNKEPLISIETDPEASGNTVMFFYKHPKQKFEKINDYREMMMSEIFSGMINARLQELAVKPDAPFIMATTNYGDFLTRTQDAFLGYAMAKENLIDVSFDVLMTEIERVRRFGFVDSELERQKRILLAKYDKQAKEHDRIESARIAMQFVYNYLASKPIPNAKQSYDIVSKLIDGISIEEINKLPSKWVTEDNLVIMVTAPERKDVKVPTRDKLLSVINAVRTKELEPYVDGFEHSALIENLPTPGTITSVKENDVLNFTELTLSNGVRVLVKTTDFKNNEILISAYSPGGHSLVADNDFLSANFSSVIISEAGIANFNKTELSKLLAGKDFEINPYVADLKEGFSGRSSIEDFEMALQMIYLYFTQPRKDQESFDSFISRTKSQLRFFGNNPTYAFYKKLVEVMTMNHPRSIVLPTPEQIDQIQLDKVFEIYTDRFADASDFTFVFVGNINLDEVKPLLEMYLGGLPSVNRKETWKDNSPKFPAKTTEATVEKGIDDKGMVAIVMKGDFEWNEANKLNINILNKILNIRLRETIREDEGGTYGVQVQMMPEKYPNSEYALTVMFGCDPKKQTKLSKMVIDEIEKIIKDGPLQDDLEKVVETLIRERETNLKKNDWWLRRIENIYYYNDPITPIEAFEESVKKVTVEDIHKAAKEYLKPNHYVKVLLVPEKKQKSKKRK